jgi:hypothetical protein
MGFINWTMAQSPVSTAPILAQSQQQEVPSAESTVGDPKLDPISLLQASQRPKALGNASKDGCGAVGGDAIRGASFACRTAS